MKDFGFYLDSVSVHVCYCIGQWVQMWVAYVSLQ